MNTKTSTPLLNSDTLNKAYIANIGMITPVGFNTLSTCAAIKAGISAYSLSNSYYSQSQKPITLCPVPEGALSSINIDIDEGDSYSTQLDHIIRMSIIAIDEALSDIELFKPIPFIFALQEPHEKTTALNTETLISNLIEQCHYPLDKTKVHFLSTGRSAGIQGINRALQYLYEENEDYVLIGGSDSYLNSPNLNVLDKADRLNLKNSNDGFVPGEGAGFLLLTSRPELARNKNNHIVSISSPGVAHESGYLHNPENAPYLGEGLDQAFKQALTMTNGKKIDNIYSSMNGERYWAKEYGVASIRNKVFFNEEKHHIHPAQNYGDLGAATGAVLMGIAANDSLNKPTPSSQLIYSSSDNSWRSAIIMETVSQDCNQLY